MPRLYQKYVGHDNNRDLYMSTQAETTNMNRVLYHEWFPQIMYNHHQTGPTGTVLFAPPFRDPFNYVVRSADPARHRPGGRVDAQPLRRRRQAGRDDAARRELLDVVERRPADDGLLPQHDRAAHRDHRQPDADGDPLRAGARTLPSGDLPFPITPQTWHFRQSIEYSLTANRAVLDVASRHREQFLFNIYLMGKRAIEKGSTRHVDDVPEAGAEACRTRSRASGAIVRADAQRSAR